MSRILIKQIQYLSSSWLARYHALRARLSPHMTFMTLQMYVEV